VKRIAQFISILALAVTIGTPLFFFGDRLELRTTRVWMLAAAAAWFLSAPFWMERKTRD
jgi:hypothetical protein